MRRFGDVCELKKGKKPRLISPQAVGAKPYLVAKYLRGGEPEEFALASDNSSVSVKSRDIIIICDGSNSGETFIGFEGVLSSTMAVVDHGQELDNRFLRYFLSTLFEKFNASKTGAAIPHLDLAALRDEQLPMPPLPEQERIVAILDEAFDDIDTAKANAERNLANARAVFGSSLESVFNHGGQGWAESRLSDLCEVKHGFAFDGAEFSKEVLDGKPIVITPGNFSEYGELVFNDRNTKRFSGKPPDGFLFNVGDLVVVMTDLSSKMKILGKPAFVETENVLHNQRIGRVVFLNDALDSRLLYYFMMSKRYLKSIRMSATGTMVKHTAPKRILSNEVSFPIDGAEQRAIVERLDSLRDKTRRLEPIYQRKLDAMDALKQSLLHHAFSGQL